jgi:hypothetical protein
MKKGLKVFLIGVGIFVGLGIIGSIFGEEEQATEPKKVETVENKADKPEAKKFKYKFNLKQVSYAGASCYDRKYMKNGTGHLVIDADVKNNGLSYAHALNVKVKTSDGKTLEKSNHAVKSFKFAESGKYIVTLSYDKESKTFEVSRDDVIIDKDYPNQKCEEEQPLPDVDTDIDSDVDGDVDMPSACGAGKHWVKGHSRNGNWISGHCRRN